MANKEEWRSVKQYDGTYEVSSLGNVRSVPRIVKYKDGRIREYQSVVLKQNKGSHGYRMVGLATCGKVKASLVHRIACEAFLVNHKSSRTVNHIDGNKVNNVLENLEWATDSENQKHAYRIGLNRVDIKARKSGKQARFFKRSVLAKKDGESVMLSGNKEMRKHGFDPVGIWRCLNGLRKTHRGFSFSVVGGT